MTNSTTFNCRFKTCSVVAAPILALALTACGGGGSGANYFEPEGSGGGSGSGGSTTDPTNTAPDVISIGAVIDGSFVQGQVRVGVDTLSAGGTTEVAVNLVNQDGDPVTQAQTVAFSSRCSADGTATLNSGIETNGGQAVSEYVANGCVGADEIRATATVDGSTLTAIGTVIVEQEDIGSLEFVSADPTQIALVGTGGDETSRVTFRLVGEAGGPIENATVDFALNATTGGLTLTADSAVTNSNGTASTTVRAGSVATSVRVTATEASTGISTQSSQLVVSTGIPDWDSVSISVESFNPEALHYDGETVEVTIRAADAFNNPVPDGTAFSFFTEGGSIDPSCTTEGSEGACSVTWRSQNPRPADGRVTLLATAIGNESFNDDNGNGRFDDGEIYEDLGEAYADENESDAYEVGEFFVDFGPAATPDGARNDPDGEYNGVLCADGNSGNCSSDRSVIVSDEIVIVMASQFLTASLTCAGTPYDVGETVTVAGPAQSCQLLLADQNGNNPPFETAVSTEVTDDWELGGTLSFDVGSGTNPAPVAFSISSDGATTGTLTVIATTPKGTSNVFNWGLEI